MPWNKSLAAFDDVRELLDKALEAPRGLKVPCSDRNHAVRLRHRMNYFRVLHRNEYAEVFEATDPRHGKSPYDKLAFRIPAKGEPDASVLYIEPYERTPIKYEVIE